MKLFTPKLSIKKPGKVEVATFITLLFHVSGCIGMFTSYKQWFIDNTFLNLVIVFVLVLYTQHKSQHFFLFMGLCIATGLVVEAIGINTGWLFGNYKYGKVLGRQIMGVPFLIGINWFIVVYCSGVIVQYIHSWVQVKSQHKGNPLPGHLVALSFVFDAALLTTFFDWVMEPVAVKLGFWSWNAGTIPLYNYVCWLVISALLLVAFRLLRFQKQNLFAVHLFFIQLLFFGILRTFL